MKSISDAKAEPMKLLIVSDIDEFITQIFFSNILKAKCPSILERRPLIGLLLSHNLVNRKQSVSHCI